MKIKVSNGIFTGSEDTRVKIFLTAINKGNKPIKLISAGIRFNNNKNMIIQNSMIMRFPFLLNGNDHCSCEIDKNYLLNYITNNNIKACFVWFEDATGRKFKSKFPVMYLRC